MKFDIPKIWKSASARNVGKLLAANIVAQALGLLVYPLLTRLYTPEDFGVLNLFASIAGVLVLLSTLEWYNAIVLPEREEEARAVVHLCLLSVGGLTLLLLFTVPFAAPIAGLFKSPQLAQYYWMLPLFVLLTALWNVLNYWYIRHKQYGRISGYQISQSLFSIGYKTGFGFLPLAGGLIYATVLAPLCSLALSVALAAKNSLRPLFVWNGNECKKAAVRYANFPKYSTPRALLNTVVVQLPILLLTPLFGNAEVGLYGMSMALSLIPINMLTKALYQVLYRHTNECVQKRLPIYHYYRQFTYLTLGGCVVLMAALFVPLPWLVKWLLGAEWELTGELIRWMFPWLICYILTFSTGFIPDIFAKQKTELLFEILMAVLRVAGLCAGIWANDFVVSIAGYAIGSALGTGARYIWQMALIRQYERSL